MSGYDVVAAHLNHGMREVADADQAACAAFADGLGIPFLAGKADVPKMARDLGIGIEEAGRKARYEFFRQGAFRTECDWIATGHTSSDNAETVLLNLARGTGISGLAGIPGRRENIIRPLLPFSREETEAYCRQHGFQTRHDAGNDDLSFSRVRMRKNVIPELERVHAGATKAILRLRETAEEEDRFLNGAAAAALEQSEVPLNGDLGFITASLELAFDRARLTSAPAVLFKRAIRLATEALGAGLSFEQVQRIAAGMGDSDGGSITAEGGEVVCEWDATRFHFRRLDVAEPFRFPLTYPGDTDAEIFGWRICAEPWSEVPSVLPRAALRTVIDLQKAKGNLYFRSLEPGDQIMPLGFGGTRKLSDLAGEAKLTQAARRCLPVVCDLVGPIWLPGVCVSERVRPDLASQRLARLTFGPIEG